MNEVKLYCAKCKVYHKLTEDYIKKYGQAGMNCGCGEPMKIVKKASVKHAKRKP